MPDIKLQFFHKAANTYDDEKINIIETMPDADAILVIWDKLMCQAAKCNDDGMVYLCNGRPFTDENLAAIFRRPVNTVRLAIQTFRELGMVEVSDQGIYLLNWWKHQNTETMQKIRDQNRERQRRFRERKQQLALPEGITLPVTLRNAGEGDGRGERGEREGERDIENKTPYNPPLQAKGDITLRGKGKGGFKNIRKGKPMHKVCPACNYKEFTDVFYCPQCKNGTALQKDYTAGKYAHMVQR